MAEKTVKVRTKQRIVNPAYDPRSGGDAVFAAGAEVSVPSELAEKWLADGRAEAVEVKAEEAADSEHAEPKKSTKRGK